VFRNEAVDRTHLAEFHQIEGVICDKGLTLSDLIGTLHQFFNKIGITQLRFKPAYNPYTEPSMEIFRCLYFASPETGVAELNVFRGEPFARAFPIGGPKGSGSPRNTLFREEIRFWFTSLPG
jgi:phenylalanyl-tRNA synthetase alpha chain